ncbi:MAG: hypothetical protein IH810_03500 [Proteobacteria bacterium]|nr:hypothetical protein [Pseudomonadota bacterium]
MKRPFRTPSGRREWLVPTLLIMLSAVPVAAGTVRLVQLAGGAEITPDNADSFHFHGDLEDLPITGILAIPRDEKARVLLMGRYEEPGLPVQIVRPSAVMDELLETVVTIRSYVVAALATVAAATLAVAGLALLQGFTNTQNRN